MMGVTILLRRGLQAIAAPSLLLLLAGYFVWNALHGAHGIESFQHLQKVEKQAENALQEAHQEQEIWHRRIRALSEKSLDPDMLDERSRSMLDDSQEGDLIIPYGKHDRLY